MTRYSFRPGITKLVSNQRTVRQLDRVLRIPDANPCSRYIWAGKMNENDIIVDEHELIKREPLVENLPLGSEEYNLHALDLATKRALVRHFLFSNADIRQRVGFGSLSNVKAFYNSYYWFLIFANRYQSKNGYDAGIEQGSFKMLEQMPPDADWKVVEEIAEAASRQI